MIRVKSLLLLAFLLGAVLQVATNSHGVNLTDKWDEYAKCKLIESEFSKLHVKTALAVFHQAQARINCAICLAPNYTASDIVWKKDGKLYNHTGQTLILNSASTIDGGIYTCTAKNEAQMSTAVRILNEEDERIQLVGLFSKAEPRKNMTLNTTLGAVDIYSQWSQWSSCSEKYNCGHVGLRKRHGPCMLDIKAFKNLSVWTNPLPCRSKMVPKELQTLRDVQMRPSEVMYSFCKVVCQKKKPTLLTGINLNGESFSTYQDISHLSFKIHRNHLFVTEGETLKLMCPGHTIDDSPIKWMADTRVIKISSNGRIQMTPLQTVVINNAKTSDSKHYSCWQQKKLLGTIRVRVMKGGMTPFDKTWSIFIVILTSSVVIMALIRVYNGQ